MAGLVVSGTQVSYIGQDCREIPEHLGRDCGHFAKRLDLSFNLLRKLLERKRERTSRLTSHLFPWDLMWCGARALQLPLRSAHCLHPAPLRHQSSASLLGAPLM
ncbi:uncharacterized protein LOC129620872 isoform X4 [Bubalus kerabau]|uniref:uncharacterized protein LOC129620872 isoform X4 n=1 Tax=Bubalus carabanensis TaxID=3119969 RepID=UPI00244E71D7|nr:uncharacterized protein LOC129620872 isoform X4 [Bubalus carabanensis]